MTDDRYVKKCHIMLKCFAEAGVSNWATNIRKLLYINSFGYVWESQNVDNDELFLSLFIQRLKDQWSQNWFERISLSSRLISYCGFKSLF